jgi:2-dehydro-3-deoxy-L-rhamnonate dehydrogenase (NAD+)
MSVATAGQGRAAIVTGGSGGIGRAILERLGADGFVPVSWSRSREVPPARLALSVDVTDAEALEAAAAETVARVGGIYALVVNAGILGPVARAWEVGPDDVRKVLEVNLVSAFLTVRAVVPHLLANAGPDRGRIVVVSSVQGKEGTALAGPYAASKAGLIALTKVLGKELAESGVLVNAVTPTVVRGPMEQSLSEERRADLNARIPMRRFLDAAEVAAMVSWLCGPDCTFSTGAVFDLSGGRSTW